ncbi:MAG: ATP-dependent helicase [Patescibacteria group bacterium]
MDFSLEKLNAEQRKAVVHNAGPLLIVAGAGTGKTTVLINRLAYLIMEKKVSTENILLITFTEKAASELEERADQILPYGYVDLWIHTFHGFAERLLREHALDIGLPADFKLMSSTEQWILLKKNLNAFKLDYYRPLGNPTKFISELLRHFSRLKDENVSAEEYLAYVEHLEKIDSDEVIDEIELKRLRELATAYAVYNNLLLQESALDFGDLIVYCLKLLKERPKILAFYRQQFEYVMVDEFQDTNWAQYELVKLLSAPTNNLVVVGDDDQSVYKFRGASISNILQFKDDFPKAEEVVLTENYRSRQEILDYAYRFIQNNNPNRLEEKLKIDKSLKSMVASNPDETSVRFLQFQRQEEELSFVAEEIFSRYTDSWKDFAILVRANDTADVFVKELNRRGIPNQFVSLRGLYYKPLIIDCLSYLKLLDNYHESGALFRVLNMDIFRVCQSDLITINKFAHKKVYSLFEALGTSSDIPGLADSSRENIGKLLALLNEHSELAANKKPSRVFVQFVYDSGLLKDLDHDRDQESFSYLNQIYRKIKTFEENLPDARLKDFLEILELELEAGETGALKLDFADDDSVKIMTVHAAKGLEFKNVFVVNAVDKKFPTISRSEKISVPDALVKEKVIASKDAHIEEERRLFYVALTRAKENLFITGAKDYGGLREKKPSRFISEMNLSITEVNFDDSFSKKLELLRDLEVLGKPEDIVEEPLVLPEQFSFSQLAAFSSCPLQYKFAFILKIPAPEDKPSLIFGRVMHSVLFDFLSPLISGKVAMQNSLFGAEKPVLLTEKRLMEIFEERWQPDGYNSKEERELYLAKGKAALHSFWDYWQELGGREILFLEKRFCFKIAGEIMKGAIDRVDILPDGRLEIVDYKTGNPKEKLDYEARRQLILYQLFLEEFLGKPVAKLSYYYLENGSIMSFEATEKEKEKLRREIEEEIEAIKKGQFPPKPSEMCKFCDFKGICEFAKI